MISSRPSKLSMFCNLIASLICAISPLANSLNCFSSGERLNTENALYPVATIPATSIFFNPILFIL